LTRFAILIKIENLVTIPNTENGEAS